jgi:carbamoyl-phosphate synthase large subunit
MGGQTALNAAMALHRLGILEKYGVELIGAKPDAIKRAEDREEFLETMKSINLEMARGGFVHTVDEAIDLIEMVGFPSIIRPSFTLGGTGGGIAYNLEEFREVVQRGLDASPVSQVLVEESVLGWKEYELEVMRDTADNVVIICSIENFDPMGVHTGDSITVAPAQTLTDKEYQKMRDASIKIIRAIGVDTGGSNIQFAVSPEDGRMLIIEMNPRVSRSSALASKATGFAIAKIAAKLAVGYTLDEIPNDITKTTPASFEPVIDYCVVKIPRWDFEKFKGLEATSSQLGVQMKSVGEVMSFGRTFKEAFQKAIRSLEQSRAGLGSDGKEEFLVDEMDEVERGRTMQIIRERLGQRRPDMIFSIRYALKLGMSASQVADITKIDPWFVNQLEQIVRRETQLREAAVV